MTDEEVIKRRRERKRKQRRRHRRIIYARRAGAVIVLVLVLTLAVKGVQVIGRLFSRETVQGNSVPVDRMRDKEKTPKEDTDEETDEYIKKASLIDMASITVAQEDEIGRGLLERVSDYPQVKVILADRQAYPDDIAQLFIKNPETLQFVLDYPKMHGLQQDIVVEEPKENEIPYYIQWDEKWGYQQYGNNIIAISGCGPTSLSMVATGLLQDKTYTPSYIANFSQANGYCTSVGTDWGLMSEGASMLGLQVKMVNLDENDVAKQLDQGHPIICSMGAGDFTDNGHFIVLTAYDNGYVTINDPNSPEKSKIKWKFEDIISQIKNIWAYWV